jgi:hypothetical protein
VSTKKKQEAPTAPVVAPAAEEQETAQSQPEQPTEQDEAPEEEPAPEEQETPEEESPAEGEPGPPPTGAVVVQNTRLKVLRSHPGYPHHPGEEVEMDPEEAKALANGGFVQLLPPAETR